MRIVRFFKSRPELRQSESGDLPDIGGIAAPFFREDDPGTQFQLWAGAVERIMPTAFDATLVDPSGPDVYSTINHDDNLVLGRQSAGTLELAKTERGLEYRVRAKDTQRYRELVIDIERGDIPDASFAFSIRRDGATWTEEERDGVMFEVRELQSITLYELGPVTNGAYQASTAEAMRSEARASLEDWKRTHKPDLSAKLARSRLNLTLPVNSR